MGSTNEQFSKIRKVMDKMRIEKYAINNLQLAVLDEYTKMLYLKVLCTVIQYKNNPSEMQILYLERIIKGMDVDQTLEELMRKGLELSEIDIEEFVSIMSKNEIRYYFVLEAILLFQMGNTEQDDYEYIAELIDICNITKSEAKCITYIAKSVLEQDADYFENAKEFMPENMEYMSWMPYIENYYTGAIKDTKNEKYYIAPDISLKNEINLPANFNEKKVSFRNLVINVKQEMNFRGCEKINFQNCEFIGKKYALKMESVGSVVFNSCKFTGFQNRVGTISGSNEIIIQNCKFNQCGYLCEVGDKTGGVFSIDVDNYLHRNNPFKINIVILEKNQLHNCYIKVKRRVHNYGVTGVFVGSPYGSAEIKKMIIKDNIFSGCECINNGNYREAMIGRFKVDKVVNKNNHATGKLIRILENE